AGLEEVPVRAALPARRVAWSLAPGQYRVSVVLEGPGLVTALSGEDPIMEARAVEREAVLQFDTGEIELRATSLVLSLSIHRYSDLVESEIVIGPFRAEGEVRVHPVGYGKWTAEVASDYAINRTIDVGTGALVG